MEDNECEDADQYRVAVGVDESLSQVPQVASGGLDDAGGTGVDTQDEEDGKGVGGRGHCKGPSDVEQGQYRSDGARAQGTGPVKGCVDQSVGVYKVSSRNEVGSQ